MNHDAYSNSTPARGTPARLKNRILIVDDDPAIQKVLDIGLTDSGFFTKVMKSAIEAIEMLETRTFQPECIILDIRMPGMSGLEAIPRLKDFDAKVQIIMLTASTDLEIGIESMKRGAFDYLVKPVHRAELVETIGKALRYRDLLVDNERLAQENREYQKMLEMKIEERTAELFTAYRQLQQTNMDTVRMLAETIEAKDHYTRGHCTRVRTLSSELYGRIETAQPDIEVLEYGALLHDIGKIGISEQLLNKNGRLTDEEYRIFAAHPVIGENILKTVDFFRPCLPIVRSHHEWYNGNGYPDGLSGDQIDPLVRIVSIADSFDAMTSNRPYRKALPVEVAIEELEKGKGVQFDPDFVDTFIESRVFEVLDSLESRALS